MNLIQSIPRSPKIKMEGLVMVPRMIDKARAYNSNTLGDYIFPCPLDEIILEFLDTDYKKFARQTQKLTDKEMAVWIDKKCLHRSEGDKEHINNKLLEQKPDTQRSLDRFNEIRNKINPVVKNITTWIDLIELEESHPSKETL